MSIEALAGKPGLAVVGRTVFGGRYSKEVETSSLKRGVNWLLRRVENDTWTQPAPIGFYFAKLWYYERLYPMVFTVAALEAVARLPDAEPPK